MRFRSEALDPGGHDVDRFVDVGVPVGDDARMQLAVGDGLDRTRWTTPSGTVHEWGWTDRSPHDLRALLGGQGVERVTAPGSFAEFSRLVLPGEPDVELTAL